MSPNDRLHDQLVAANTRLAQQRATSPASAAPASGAPALSVRPTRRRAVVALATVAAVTGGITIGSLAIDSKGPGSGLAASVLPGPVEAMADQLAARKGILHVVGGEIRYRSPGQPWRTMDPGFRDEAWVALDGTGWRDRVVNDAGEVSSDGLQRADGSEQVMRRSGTPRTTPAPKGQTKESRLPRQAWGSFVGAQLMGVGELQRIGEDTLDGRPVVLVRDERLSSDRRDVTYAFDERTGALKQVCDESEVPGGVFETVTDVASWEIEPDTPELRWTLTTLDRLTAEG
jgi:hypothetical protein